MRRGEAGHRLGWDGTGGSRPGVRHKPCGTHPTVGAAVGCIQEVSVVETVRTRRSF